MQRRLGDTQFSGSEKVYYITDNIPNLPAPSMPAQVWFPLPPYSERAAELPANDSEYATIEEFASYKTKRIV